MHNEKRESYGHSLIVDPWGVVVGKLDDPNATGEKRYALSVYFQGATSTSKYMGV